MGKLELRIIPIGLIAVSGSVQAQDLGAPYFNQALGGMITNQIAITQAGIGRNLAQEARRGSSVSSLSATSEAVADASILSFQPSMTTRRRNFARFVAKTRAVDPEGAKSLEAQLNGGDIIGSIGNAIAPVGLRTDNVADAMAIYVMEAWEVVSGKTLRPSRARAQAVKRQMVRAIASTPEFAQADDAAKQELAEALLVHAAMVTASAEAARSGGPDQVRAVSDAVAKGARATLGFDLRAMDMTDQGLSGGRETGAADSTPGTPPQALAASNGAGVPSSYGFLAAAGGAGLGAAFLIGKAMGRKG